MPSKQVDAEHRQSKTVIWLLLLIFIAVTVNIIISLKQPDLSQQGIQYTRNVTKIWCVFFTFNASVAFYSATFLDIEIWVLYNGFISYILMALIFVSELIYRKLFLKIKV